MNEPLWRDRLEAHVRAEGGRWNSARMLKACQAVGHNVTVQRARLIFQHLAERQPELLARVEGTRWSYDTVLRAEAIDSSSEGGSAVSARAPVVRATHHEVTLVPRDHPNGRWYTIHVASHGRGRWIVYREHCETGDTTPALHCLTPDGAWFVPADPSWHGVPTYGLEEALRLAVEAAPGVTVAGVRAADVEL